MDRQADENASYATEASTPSEMASTFPPSARQQNRTASPPEERLLIAIASTFTGDLLRHPLEFWMNTLDLSAEVHLAPYAQVMQQLLDPQSLFSKNQRGFNILILRVDDWIRDRLTSESVEANLKHLQRVSKEFQSALNVLRSRTSAPLFVLLSPISSITSAEYRGPIEGIESGLLSQLGRLAHTHCWTHRELVRLYPVNDYEDLTADRIAHIPYTGEYFTAMATLLARRIAVLQKPPYKVIAIDCDNTLWGGICGEDGPAGVALTPAHLNFQRMLIGQYDAGMLLCLCTKNNASDVEAVFRDRPEMLLHQEHLSASRANWKSKSSNLQSLAQELDLALDSFIFVDDSPVECAEVKAHCPSVLTLQFPGTANGIEHFVDHSWAFDRVGVTPEARRRTAQYRENRARAAALEQSKDLDRFLASLELTVEVSPMTAEHLPRVAELVQRTNQFNLTTIRRRAADIEALWSSGELQSLVVFVRDRFGDYGLVGAVLYHEQPGCSLDVDTFVLSCRALGRGVEHRIVKELANVARRRKLPSIVLKYTPTPRNAPAKGFLEQSFDQFRVLAEEGRRPEGQAVFAVPLGYAENLDSYALIGKAPAASTGTDLTRAVQSAASTEWHEAAYRLSRLSDIMREVDGSMPRGVREAIGYVAPQNPTENAVAAIWSEVLGTSEIGARDDFFKLGGDSLLAVQVIARIGSVLGADLSLYEFFEGPTVEDVASKLAASAQTVFPIERMDRAHPIPLSSAQKRLWFIDQLEGGSTAYHVSEAVRLRGKLNTNALQAALDTIVERHEALRTSFIQVGAEPLQRIAPEVGLNLTMVDLEPLGSQEREFEIVEQMRSVVTAPFDLKVSPLIRCTLFRLSENEHILLLTMHHMISDGWSLGVLIRELGSLYNAYRAYRPNPLPPLPIQFADYAHWQQQQMTGPALEAQLGYWTQHLRGAPKVLKLPTDRPRSPRRSHRGSGVGVLIPPDVTGNLKALAQRLNLTMAMVLYSAWSIVLSRMSGETDIVVGMPVANRRRSEFEALIGLFVNTLALRVRLDDDPSLSELLRQVKETFLRAQTHQDAPFDRVVDAVQPVRSLRHSPVFQVMFVLQSTLRWTNELAELTAIRLEIPHYTAQFDLLLSLHESAEGITGTLNYSSDLFDCTTIERWVTCFEVVLSNLTHDLHLKLSQLPLMSPEESRRVIERFNAPEAQYPQQKPVHELFEGQVRRAPNAVAVVCEGRSLTYAKLNAKANQLARYLRARDIGPDQLVAICVERSLEMVVGLLGILKAGGAYVPLDPSYPPERLRYMLADAAPRVLLAQAHLRESLPQTDAEIFELDGQWTEIAQQPAENLDNGALGLRCDHLAYVIYTSGSTGKPKGVMVEHRNVTRLLSATGQWFNFNDRDVWTLFHSFAFDFSVWELWGALLYGGRLVVVPYLTTRSPADFYHLMCTEGVTVLNQTPTAFSQLICAQSHAPQDRHSLRLVIFGGETLELATLRRWVENNGATRPQLVNMYGITETTVHVTYHPLTEEEIHTEPGSIVGKPIPDLRAYLLEGHRHPVPIGVAGDIYIGGAGVARGYLNRPELTAERFVANPFSSDPTARLYKTGDLGRWRADGNIECLGRNDDQVKIRGFRIELGEIESQLLQHAKVKQAVVIAREDVPGNKRLVAYVILSGAHEVVSVEALRSYLKAVLPEHMVPSAFVMLKHLPLTSNGKLDRRALPAPELEDHAGPQYEAPQGEIEEVLAGIWQGLLRVKRVGRQDNFFELGGHSILIVQMMERLRRVGLSAKVREVFECPTMANLAKRLIRGSVEQFEVPPNLIPPGCEAITPRMLPLVELSTGQIDRIVRSVPGGALNVQDIYPLTPMQEGLLFHYLLQERATDTYVRPMLMSLSSRDRLEDFASALQELIDRHDVLRTAILWDGLPQPVQVVYREATLPIEQITLDCSRGSVEQLKERMRLERQRMDLQRAPLMRLQIAAEPNGSCWYAVIQTHHLILDNESLHTMFAEVAAYADGRPDELPRPMAYRNHVGQVLAYTRRSDAEVFFRSKLGDVTEPTAPFGMLSVVGDGSSTKKVIQALDPAFAQQIRTQARILGVTVATLFHTGWALVVSLTSGRVDVVFGSVLLGRLQGTAGAQRTLGMFINTLPLRVKLQGASATELVEQTQKELAQLLNHEHASLAQAQRCSGIAGSQPLFSALLNFVHRSGELQSEFPTTAGVTLLASEGGTNYPIVLSVYERGDGFTFELETDSLIDPHRLLGYMFTAMRSLVDALQRVADTPALSLSVMPERERHQVLVSFNETQAPYPHEKLIHELFEEQVERTPDAIAVVYGRQALSYADVNGKANRLARCLRGKGLCPDELVGICVERSTEMVVGLLGILKAGGAYVPLDPSYPAERLRYMLRDAAPKILLTQERLRERLPDTTAEVIALDNDSSDIAESNTENLDPKTVGLQAGHLAYVIYTSGTTGHPKGVMIEHRNVVNLWQGLEHIYRQLRVCRRIAVNASFNFDASVKQFTQLLSGRTMVIVPEETRRDTAAFLRFIRENRVDGIDCTPSQLTAWISAGLLEEAGHRPALVLVGGEEIATDLWSALSRCSETEFYNVYGPTECTVDATAACLKLDRTGSPSIGRPMENKRIYLLNRYGRPAPMGVEGEIYIGGAGIARGYLNRPDLTASRFVADPFSTDPQARLYKSGDLGRWRPDGAIEYMGRNDNQVKIRGYRVNLGEIEAQLMRHEQVRDAVVTAREDVPGEKRLVAYVSPSEFTETGPSGDVLRAHLRAVVPDYMMPAAFVVLDHLPLTPNGKLNRSALPAPEIGSDRRSVYETPQGEVENILAAIWGKLLRVERVGRHDNFFELGGHSLLVTRALSHIRERLRVELPVRALFDKPSLMELSALVERELRVKAAQGVLRGDALARELRQKIDEMSDAAVLAHLAELENELGGYPTNGHSDNDQAPG